MFRRSFYALTVIAALAGCALLPATALAKDHGRKNHGKHVGRGHVRHDNGLHLGRSRFFDRDHRDYHRWNRDEDVRYRHFLTERHHRYLAFPRAGRPLQHEYWQWRHEHDGR